nr:hypothetical protein [Leptothoe spongobia]
MGSTTLDREILDRSAEPDDTYYIQDQPLVGGRDVDQDPPPDAELALRKRVQVVKY